MKEKICKHNIMFLSYSIDFYFHDYKLAIEIDENGHSDRSIDYEIKRQKVIKQELGCKFIRIDPDKKTLIFLELSMKYLDTLNNQLKKTLINKISTRLLGLEFKSNNVIKLKDIKVIVKKLLPDYK